MLLSVWVCCPERFAVITIRIQTWKVFIAFDLLDKLYLLLDIYKYDIGPTVQELT